MVEQNFKAKETGSMAVLVNNHFHPLPAAYEGGPLRLQGLTPGRVQLDFILLDSVEATATAPVLAHVRSRGVCRVPCDHDTVCLVCAIRPRSRSGCSSLTHPSGCFRNGGTWAVAHHLPISVFVHDQRI